MPVGSAVSCALIVFRATAGSAGIAQDTKPQFRVPPACRILGTRLAVQVLIAGPGIGRAHGTGTESPPGLAVSGALVGCGRKAGPILISGVAGLELHVPTTGRVVGASLARQVLRAGAVVGWAHGIGAELPVVAGITSAGAVHGGEAGSELVTRSALLLLDVPTTCVVLSARAAAEVVATGPIIGWTDGIGAVLPIGEGRAGTTAIG